MDNNNNNNNNDKYYIYLMSTNKRKLNYANQLCARLNLPAKVVPIPPVYNGEQVKRELFCGPLLKEQYHNRNQFNTERPTQPWGEEETKLAASKRTIDEPNHNTITIENGMKKETDKWIDFVVVRLYIFGQVYVFIGGFRSCKPNVKPPIGDKDFKITRDEQFDLCMKENSFTLKMLKLKS